MNVENLDDLPTLHFLGPVSVYRLMFADVEPKLSYRFSA